MDALTAGEVLVLNNLTDVRNPSVDLGTKLQQIISTIVSPGTPVNAVEATATFEVTGVSIDGETVTIGQDVYEFLADDEQTKTNPTNHAVDISANSTGASQSLTVAAQPTSGDTMTIGSRTYIFVPDTTANAEGEVSIGTDKATAQANIVAALNGTDGHNTAHPQLVHPVGDFAIGDTTFIGARVHGTAGNSIATTETFTNAGNVFGGATLTGGANCSAANTATLLSEAINSLGLEPVTNMKSGNNLELTASVAGVLANSIALSDTMANGNFTGGATHLSGGVDGTVGSMDHFLIDTDFLYVCVEDNTVSGKNWRRIAVGEPFTAD